MTNKKRKIGVVAPGSRMSSQVAARVQALVATLYPDRTPEILGEPSMPINKVISATKWKGWFGWKQVTQSRTQRGIQNVRNQFQKQDRLMARVTL